jgi:hypothetical protein
LRGVISYLLIAIFSLVGVHALSRAKATSAASEFMPTTTIRLVVPEGTPIRAVLKNLFTTSTRPGDSARAFVTEQVMVDGSVAIPTGSRLDGIVERITTTKALADVSLRFNSLLIGQTSWPITTELVETNAPIESDFEILSNALGTIASTGFGVAIGASGGTQGGVTAGMTAGAMRAATVDSGNIKITVILAEPLDLIR